MWGEVKVTLDCLALNATWPPLASGPNYCVKECRDEDRDCIFPLYPPEGSALHGSQPQVARHYLFLGGVGGQSHPKHIRVARPGMVSELQLLAYTTVIATPELSHIFGLCHSSQHHWILNPLSVPGIEPASSWILGRFITAEPRLELLS